MRLWTLHPRYLDTKGLLAVWREGLLAQKVLQNETVGYRNHPQLRRFRSSTDPVAAIGMYLEEVYQEAIQRGYQFTEGKILRTELNHQIPCTRGQLLYEWEHLRGKLRQRDINRYLAMESISEPEPHPLFYIVEGEVEDWEIRAVPKLSQKVKTLVLCGDHWHSPHIAREGLGALAGTEFSFDWIEDAQDWSPEIMVQYPLIILTKSDNVSSTNQTGWMTDSVQRAFADYVHKGNGLLAIHSGTAGYAEKPVLRSLLGGVFVHHPEQCPVTMIPRAEHPLSAGIAPFTLKDEHYFMALDDSQAEVLMTTRSEHGEQPGGWRRRDGSGRVVVLTPGHNLEIWLHPSFQMLVRNAIHWCGH